VVSSLGSSSGESALGRLGAGMDKGFAFPNVYDENVVVLMLPVRRVGDLFGLHGLGIEDKGDFDRATEAKGDAEPEKASNPDLFAVPPKGRLALPSFARLVEEVASEKGGRRLVAEGDGEVAPKTGFLLSEKTLPPKTEANGDLGEAYAIKPP
jgi:hypothetical protein